MTFFILEIVVLEKRNMSTLSFCLILGFVSFSRAYTNYNMYNKDYSPNYCIFGNSPVCGTNGHEFFLLDNECELNKFNSKQLQKGQPILAKTTLNFCYSSAPPAAYNKSSYNSYCPQYCTKILRPVCGSFRNMQRNFTNECEFKRYICKTKENWQIVLNGTCVAAPCPLNGQEVCASFNGYTQSFPNLLSLYNDIQTKGKNWEILNVGPCPCPMDYRPICAQLNCTTRTFTNECFLKKEIKETKNVWSLLFYGECPEIPISTTAIPSNTSAATVDLDDGLGSGDDIDITLWRNLDGDKLNYSMHSKPVYIVKNDKINPYLPQVYPNNYSTKSKEYYSSVQISNNYKDSYKNPTQIVHEKPLYPNENLYKNPSNPNTDLYSKAISNDYKDSYKNPTQIIHEKPLYPNENLYKNPSNPNTDLYSKAISNNYKDCYKNPTQIVYEKPLYPTENLYKNPSNPNTDLYSKPIADVYSKNILNYAASSSPPDYQSFFKSVSAPMSFSAASLVSSNYNSDNYAAQAVPDMDYKTTYAETYGPVSYMKMPGINYGAISYDDEGAYNSFT